MRLHGVVLNAVEPQRLEAEHATRFGQLGTGLQVRYRKAATTERPPHAGYWKVGVLTPDLSSLRDSLIAKGASISPARQFLDIGFLCHLADGEGNTIELLQHTFDGEPKTRTPPSRIGHLTLRIRNPEASLRFYRAMGMRLLSVQPVAAHRFTLYFLAFTDERPPCDDLEAARNRPWLWQRPYPCLELQHRWDTEAAFYPGGSAPGLHALLVQGDGATPGVDPDGYRWQLPSG